jgi:FkbM family methyltransferase
MASLSLSATIAQLALQVRESVRFWSRVALRRRSLARYRLRGSGTVIHLRHGTADIDTFDEIFRRGHYDLPAAVEANLRRVPQPLRAVDLGANIGLFGVHLARLFAGADVVAVEPHPANASVLRKTLEANPRTLNWKVVEACADVKDGTVPFVALGFTTSRVEPGSEAVSVPAVDVLPLLQGADLVKIDIEGGEWPILLDSRFGGTRPLVIALEYHQHGCPEQDPGALARRLLEHAGYRTVEAAFDLPPGQGMLWAWRERKPS